MSVREKGRLLTLDDKNTVINKLKLDFNPN